jgi:hypothetical protein
MVLLYGISISTDFLPCLVIWAAPKFGKVDNIISNTIERCVGRFGHHVIPSRWAYDHTGDNANGKFQNCEGASNNENTNLVIINNKQEVVGYHTQLQTQKCVAVPASCKWGMISCRLRVWPVPSTGSVSAF